MMEMLARWVNTPAKWYQFWLPGSGFLGGTFVVLVVLAIVWFALELIGG